MPSASELPDHGLDAAFELPDSIQENEGMVALHGAIRERMEREASGLPMNTVQRLLLERIATFYVQTKMREKEGVAVKELRELNSFWLSMTQEFNRLLTAQQDKLRDQLFLDIQTIVQEGITETIDDQKVRQELRQFLSAQFAQLDL
jgi:hypothetical protein